MFRVPEPFRYQGEGPLWSDASYGNNGCFILSNGLRIIASTGEGWEHVSASFPTRIPTWQEMCVVKDLFWDPEDCCVQYHPPHNEYVNVHPYTLHIWRPIDTEFPRPPTYLIG